MKDIRFSIKNKYTNLLIYLKTFGVFVKDHCIFAIFASPLESTQIYS